MKAKTTIGSLFAVIATASILAAPLSAQAQGRGDWQRNRDRDQERHYYRDRDRDRQYRRDHDRQNWRDRDYDRRQQTKNEWRNIAIGAGGLGILGLLNHDNTLTFGGLAGSLYSLNRYEQDRRSQNTQYRTRAEYFSRPYFYRNGQRFDRRIVNRNGQRYYQFYRH